jgi:hypothetical protein
LADQFPSGFLLQFIGFNGLRAIAKNKNNGDNSQETALNALAHLEIWLLLAKKNNLKFVK